MKKLITLALVVVNIAIADPPRTPHPEVVHRRGAAAAHSSYDTLAYSMLLWGAGMGATAALLAAFVQGSRGDTTSVAGGSSAHFASDSSLP